MTSTATDGGGQTDAQFLLDILFNHKMEWIKQFLKRKGQPTTGNKPDLRNRIEDCLDEATIDTSDLVDLLDQVEGWGNQHAFLYEASNELIATLSDKKALKAKLATLGLTRLFNDRIPLVRPDLPTLSAIEWSVDRVRFIWVEKRTYREPRGDESYSDGTIEYDAYEVKRSRGIISFSCDLVTGLAELLIQRLPRGNDYQTEHKKFIDELADVFDVKQLKLQKISGAIKKVDQSKQIRKRSSKLATALGYQATYTSRSRKDDVYDDPTIRKARKALGATVAGRLGNFYWPILGRDIHVKLYAKDQRVGIFGECTETEVANVLSEVRGYS
jgi:hypothetical protein